MKIPELLAPVGGKEAFRAAVQNGADAVYLGGQLFSARQFADNFDRAEMNTAIEYAHIRGVKVYVTVNTLVADSEFGKLVDYLKFLHEAGADAIIVQDPGIAMVVRELLPGLALHASTQMTINNSSGAVSLKSLGFARVVLAREVSLREITQIKQKTGMELEVFVHGALCVSYSGQCLMSSMIGGRSGNRGRCAQPCRMEYTFVDEKKGVLADPAKTGSHLLSPRDLNMIKYIPELAQAGVDSLKIEGRMKRPEYVAAVTRVYREALDRYRSSPEDYSVPEKDLKDLTQIFNRGFTTGYFFGKQGRDMMSYKRPNNRGLRLGRVTRTDWAAKMAELALEDSLHQGDGIEFWVTDGGRAGVVVNRILAAGEQVTGAGPGEKVWVPYTGKVKPGDRVFKTHDAELISQAEQSYKSTKEIKKIPLDFTVRAAVGRPLEITAGDAMGNVFTAQGSSPGQEALNKPLTPDYLQKQMDRLGNTPFEIGNLHTEIQGNVMVPASEINETRRIAVEGLAELRARKMKPEVAVSPDFAEKARRIKERSDNQDALREQRAVGEPELIVHTARYEILKIAVENGVDSIYFRGSDIRKKNAALRELEAALSLCTQNNIRLVIASPRIVREEELEYIRTLTGFAISHDLPFLAANLGTLFEAKKEGIKEIYADYGLNIFNSQTLSFLKETYGITRAAVSPELTLNQISRLAGPQLEAIVEGHLPLMVTEYCPTGSILGGLTGDAACGNVCRSGGAAGGAAGGVRGLKDRLGLVFPVSHDEFCRTYIYNAKELSMIEDIQPLYEAGITGFRLEMSNEAPDRAAVLIKNWRRELDRFIANPGAYQVSAGIKDKFAGMSPAGLTKGHYYRGVE
ncbi:DUF3656 domain-containing U32 family peptidase [Phosphitispora fastidiosa]|uniref:DUF3656 domain-containing U32 family peptidase n=1 Tax=Phosphitispora fastidiosa TaxID=2837202 RepID=UPI001E3B75AD|nr:U32 family peptidase [Phosphitispora fastidiosa]MBU7007250.1 putative protease [Phosphitispora fastidiosa]